MKMRTILPFRILACIAALFVASCANTTATSTASQSSKWNAWVQRPWGIRYIVRVEEVEGWNYRKSLIAERNQRPRQKFFDWEEFFVPGYQVAVKPEIASAKHSLAIVLVEFDSEGVVRSPNSHDGQLRGRLNVLQRVGLSEADKEGGRYFDIGHWFTGVGDESTDWAPGICMGSQMDDAANGRSDSYLYGSLFKPDGVAPLFGCREWANQLRDPDRP